MTNTTNYNPNNCSTCKHNQTQHLSINDGWCYMFSEEPEHVCMKHTERTNEITTILIEAEKFADLIAGIKSKNIRG